MIEWSEQHKAVQQMVRRFVQAEIKPKLEELEHGDTPPYDVLRKLLKTFGMDEMSKARFASQIAREKEAAAKGEPPPARRRADGEGGADRGDAVIVSVVADAAASERVPRDLLLALGWAETRLEPRPLGPAAGAHESDDPAAESTACGVFGLDEGSARDEAARLVGATPDALCEAPDLEARAAAARLRVLAGGDAAPPLAGWLRTSSHSPLTMPNDIITRLTSGTCTSR